VRCRGCTSSRRTWKAFANFEVHQIMHLDTRFLYGRDEVPKNEMTTKS